MKTAKLGIIFVVGIMALAGVGAGYAHWTDIIYIEGTVSTGSVGWEFIDHSGTYAFKDTDTDDLVVLQGLSNNPDYYLCGYAHGVILDDHHGLMKFDNIFPLGNDGPWHADLVIHYTGTVPGKINSITIDHDNSNWWDNTPAAPGAGTGPGTIDWITEDKIYVTDTNTDTVINPSEYGLPGDYFTMDNICGVQLHECYNIEFVLEIIVPNDNAYQGFGPVYFDVDVEVINWNEYPHAPSGIIP